MIKHWTPLLEEITQAKENYRRSKLGNVKQINNNYFVLFVFYVFYK
jgi:hypothetical protein